MARATDDRESGSGAGPVSGATPRAAAWPCWPWLALILAASVLPRLPILCNAAALFNSDEAVNALVIKHLLAGRELTLFNWGATYYGIVEGLLAVPFVGLLGTTALAFKLGALCGYLLLVAAAFLLGSELYGRAGGLSAAALLIAFSPQLVFWSTLASSGYCLIVAWGTLTFLALARLRRAPSALAAAGLGFMIGFGLYLYELYLVYVAALLGWSLLARRPWEALLGVRRRPADAAGAAGAAPAAAMGGEVRALAARTAALAGGLLLGVLPRLALLVTPHAAGKEPLFVLGLGKAAGNLKLLLLWCAPGLLGLSGGGGGASAAGAGLGPAGRHAWLLALPLALVLGAALAAAAWRCRRELLAPPLRRPAERLTMESLLVCLAAADALLFLLSPNPQDVLASRYLLPCLTSASVLGGGWLARLGGRRPRATGALAALLVLLPLIEITMWYRAPGPFQLLDPGLRVARRTGELQPVLELLRARRLRGAYGSYWTAYSATFLSGEAILVAPYRDWDRYPPYTRAVDRLPDVAYVFRGASDPGYADFLARLGGGAGRRAAAVAVGPYTVFLSRDGRRLLPPLFAAAVVRLRQPLAAISATGVPPTARAGERLAIRVRAVNRSDAAWSAAGLAGALRVAVSYHWFDAGGRLVAWEGDRSPLPHDVRQGEAVEVAAQVVVPSASGRLVLAVTLVQEGAAWFDRTNGSTARFAIEVRPGERR
jgi:hypothetical protein